MKNMQDVIRQVPVIPVLVIDNIDHAVPVAKALCDGGIHVLEVTLRTACALEAIARIREQIPHAIVGAGTVVTPDDLQRVVEAGAAFAVSPGTTAELIDAASRYDIGFLPGISTPSEAMNLFRQGYDCLKFFPAEASGGVEMLKAIYGPLPQLMFCPTGGISFAKAKDYLALPNVACVGGSWLAQKELVVGENWEEIQSRATAAAGLA